METKYINVIIKIKDEESSRTGKININQFNSNGRYTRIADAMNNSNNRVFTFIDENTNEAMILPMDGSYRYIKPITKEPEKSDE